MNPQHKCTQRNSLSWNTTKKKSEGSWTRGRIIFFKIILFRMAVFWKLRYLGYYGRGGLGLGLRLGLRLGLGLRIHKSTEGYLYFRKYRYAGYAILRDTHIYVTPASLH